LNFKISIFAFQKDTQMNHALFSENTKMADVILANSRLLYVLPYFEMNLGFGEKTVKQVCSGKNISAPLFLLVCNIYTFDDYCPDSRDLKQIPVEGIIKYLRNSHKDYLEVRMPQIIASILFAKNTGRKSLHISNMRKILFFHTLHNCLKERKLAITKSRNTNAITAILMPH